MRTLTTALKSHWHWQSPYLRYAVRLSSACLLIVTLYSLLALPNGYWAAFSVIACVWPTQGISLQRIRQRLIGTFLGMWLGILIAHFFLSNGYVIDALLPVFIFLMFYLKAYDYSFFVFFTTVVTMLFVCLLLPGDWQMAIVRLEMTVLGVFIAFLSTLFILPVQSSRQLPRRLKTVVTSLKTYFSLLCDYYHGQESHNLPAIQTQTFNYLQRALDSLYESRFEFGPGRKDPAYKKASKRIALMYEKMLYLDIHTPKQFDCQDLSRIYAPLGEVMHAMIALFDRADTAVIFQLNTRLADLQATIKLRRTRVSLDPTQKAAIFHDYMQFSLFIEILQSLLVDLDSHES